MTKVTLDAAVSGGTSPYTYSWTDSNGNVVGDSEDITVNNPGTYTLTVTGANGCSASDSVTVTQDITPPVVKISADHSALSCAVTSLTLKAAASGGTPPYSYQWTDSAGKPLGNSDSLTVTNPDTYTVVVTGANGCSTTAQFTVSQDILAPEVKITTDIQALTCANSQAHLKAEVEGGRSPYTYQWFDSSGELLGDGDTITATKPDNYRVVVTGANGCSACDKINITQDITPPLVDAGPIQTLSCIVKSVTLNPTVIGGSSPYTYQWSGPNGKIIVSGVNTGKITVDRPGTYTLTVTGANGCSASDSVTVAEDFAAPVVDAGPDREITCTVKEVTLSATVSGGKPPYTFVWQTENGKVLGTSDSITVDQAGTYIVTAIGANGCCSSDAVVVMDNTTPPIIDAGPDKFLTCSAQKAYLHVDISGGYPPYSIVWTDDCGTEIGTTADITVDLPGIYAVTVTGANGCSASDTVKVIDAVDPPQVDAGPDKVLTCDVTEVTLDATVTGGTPPYTHEWRNACGTIVGNTEDITVSVPSTYTLIVTGADGCMASDSVVVTKE